MDLSLSLTRGNQNLQNRSSPPISLIKIHLCQQTTLFGMQLSLLDRTKPLQPFQRGLSIPERAKQDLSSKIPHSLKELANVYYP